MLANMECFIALLKRAACMAACLACLTTPAHADDLDDFHRAVVDEKENRGIIAAEAERAFGRPLVVQCAPLSGPVAPPADVEPLIDRAIAWFAGDVIEAGGRPVEGTRG